MTGTATVTIPIRGKRQDANAARIRPFGSQRIGTARCAVDDYGKRIVVVVMVEHCTDARMVNEVTPATDENAGHHVARITATTIARQSSPIQPSGVQKMKNKAVPIVIVVPSLEAALAS